MRDDFPSISPEQQDFVGSLKTQKRSPGVILRHARGILATARQGAAQSVPQTVYVPADVVGEVTADNSEMPKLLREATLSVSQVQQSGVHIAVVFGVAATMALQNLRGKVEGFDNWWSPRSSQLQTDELARYFYLLRSVILKEGYLDILAVAFTVRGNTGGEAYGVIETRLYGAPSARNDVELSSVPVADLLTRWLDTVEGFLNEAAEKWVPSGSDPMEGFAEEFRSSTER